MLGRDNINFNNDDEYSEFVNEYLKLYYPLDRLMYFTFDENYNYKQPYYDNISKLCLRIFNNQVNFNPEEIRAFRNSSLCNQNPKRQLIINGSQYNTFITNILPLGTQGDKQEIWEKSFNDYQLLFGLRDEEINKETYINKRAETRFEILRNLTNNNRLTICFGVGNERCKLFLRCFATVNLLNMFNRNRDNFHRKCWKKFKSYSGYYYIEDCNLLILPHISININLSYIINSEDLINTIQQALQLRRI